MIVGIWKVDVTGPRGGEKIRRYFINEGNGDILFICRTKKYGVNRLVKTYGDKVKSLVTYKGIAQPSEMAMARADMMQKAKKGA